MSYMRGKDDQIKFILEVYNHENLVKIREFIKKNIGMMVIVEEATPETTKSDLDILNDNESQ